VTAEQRVDLIRPGVAGQGGVWADLGAGSGAFTFALADLLGPAARIHAVDRSAASLRALEGQADGRYPGIVCMAGDFTQELPLPPLDGVLAANCFHFHADACRILEHAAAWLKPGGTLIVVEYDVVRANPWVPHPLPWDRLTAAAECAGLRETRFLGSVASTYHRRMYAGACRAPATIRK
jgi:ubiquinone/menaquinone biosynthesis C-methylase UbiE